MNEPAEEQTALTTEQRLSKAAHLRVQPGRLREYARILEAVELSVESRNHSELAQVEADQGMLAAAFGEVRSPGDATKAYYRISEAASSALRSIQRLQDVIDKNKPWTPESCRSLGHAQDVVTMILFEASLAGLPKAAKKRQPRSQHPTREQATLTAWYKVPDYPNKLRDMHELAKAWCLSDIEDIEDFRRHIRRLRKRGA